ncbi:hypothetical protein EW145_g8218, partial [Phellinidium pouzarii]
MLDAIERAILRRQTVYSAAALGIPGLRHFVYKSRPHVQVTHPEWGEDYADMEARRRLITLYQSLHDVIHGKSGQKETLKLQYIRTQRESVMGWITQPFELYISVSPTLPKAAVVSAANAVMRWVKKEEARLFLRDAPMPYDVFSNPYDDACRDSTLTTSTTAPLLSPIITSFGKGELTPQPPSPLARTGLQRHDMYGAESPYTPAEQTAGRLYASTASVYSGKTASKTRRHGGTANGPNSSEPDDALHDPDPKRDKTIDMGGTVFTGRGLANVGCLLILGLGIFALFAGWPVVSHFLKKPMSTLGGFNIGGTNRTGQIASIGNFGLIDKDTPSEARTKASYVDGSTLELVFSDEFNTDGRRVFTILTPPTPPPRLLDDPYWEAVDLHYWETNNLEWYDPSAITTKDGYLQITLSNITTHGMSYQGGMITSWNKFCFTGGLFEASVSLPGANNIHGLWPAVWSMGNLGRAGYGASLDGTWPYSYDSCDVGTLANQTLNGLPIAATENGDPSNNNVLSFLPGQRLSRCTCPGES